MNATYDAIKAFEINATYNDMYDVSDTLKEDIEAAISTFMSSLATSLGVSGYREENIKPYVPAIVFTLYDGYYIYAPTKMENADGTKSYEYMLKPYNYYTVRYKDPNNSGNDVVINYTLDNYIVVYGWINGEYTVTSGYLVSNDRSIIVSKSETLEATVPYKERNGSSDLKIGEREITNEEYNPNYTDSHLGETDNRADFLYPRNENFYVDSKSAQKYYEEALEFTDEIEKLLSWIRPNMAMRNNVYLCESDDWFNDTTTKVFSFSQNNDPEASDSIFADHKTNVIRNSIQNNLNQAITAYSQDSIEKYEFRLPNLKTEEWDMISTNVCILTFLQGLPVGNKYYNNYSLVTSTTNKLYVTKENMYFTSDNDSYYHKIDCEHMIEDNTLVGFSAFDYETKRVKKDNGEYQYYHKHNINETESKKACYYCIVSSEYEHKELTVIREKALYTALAREKHMRYTTTNYFGDES